MIRPVMEWTETMCLGEKIIIDSGKVISGADKNLII